MANDTITLRLSGDVLLDEYAIVVRHLGFLVKALAKDVAGGVEVEWNVDDLQGGSAVTTLRGLAKQKDLQPQVEEIVKAYEQVGVSMEQGLRIPYSEEVADAARGITGVLNGRIDDVRFETEEAEAIITSAPSSPSERRRPSMYAYGAIEGRVQTLSSRNELKFTLYDAFGRGIPCHLQKGDEDMMRDAWEKWVVVEGWVRRDASGQPLSIRRITDVVVREHGNPEGYREARGAVPVSPDAISSEEAIRRLRDA